MNLETERKLFVSLAVCASLWFLPNNAYAHCDTLDGPVVLTAKAALEKVDITPVLKWIRKEDEKTIIDQFNNTLAVRKQGRESKELADMYFFETLVRIHRAGEGAPYTGLKPGAAVDPPVAAADKALETGSADKLVKLVTDAAEKGIRERFARAAETKKHADHTVDAGRAFVAAYVEFTHYVERLHMDASIHGGHAEEPGKSSTREQHRH